MINKLSILAEESAIVKKIVEFITGFFAIIPQTMYLLYSSAACLLDVMQYLIRKLAGLDVYYVDGEAVSGDIVLSFIKGIIGKPFFSVGPEYSALSTTFWSLVLFGFILLVITTILSIIKSHYNYDSAKSQPMAIVFSSIKSFSLMVIVPIVAIFGLYISQVLLQTLDSITTNSNAEVAVFQQSTTNGNGEVVYENSLSKGFKSGISKSDILKGENHPSYVNYDYFGYTETTNTTTFSGILFKAAAYNCNRVRTGSYSVPKNEGDSAKKWTNFGVFYSNVDNEEDAKEAVAAQIDYAFANALTLIDENRGTADVGLKDSFVTSSALTNPVSLIFSSGLINVKGFSKYNVGLVFYYYDLWGFNWLIAFGGIIAFFTIFGNIVFGLITRLVQLLALFLVFPPLVGIAPLDDGNGFKKWKQQYISDTIMAYGAIVGMNLLFLILPFLNSIRFFNIAFLDVIMDTVIILEALTMVGNLIKMLSSFIGGSDANATGEQTKKATAELGSKALNSTLKAANVGVSAFKLGGGGALGLAGKGIKRGASALGDKIKSTKFGQKVGSRFSSAANYFSKDSSAERKLNRYGKDTGVDWNGTSTEDKNKQTQYIKNEMSKFESQREADAKAQGTAYNPLSGQEKTNKENEIRQKAAAQQARWDGTDGKGLAGKKKQGIIKGVSDTFLTRKSVTDENGYYSFGSTLKATGQGLLDVGKLSVDLIGKDLLHGKAAMDNMKKSNAFYSARDLGKKVGMKGLDSFEYMTDKEKAKAEEAAKAAMRKNVSDSNEYLRQIRDVASKIANNLNNQP